MGPRGLLYRSDGGLFDTTWDTEITTRQAISLAVMVMDEYGNMYAVPEARQSDEQLTHASLLNGAPAAAAALIEVRAGVLTRLSDEGGEYPADPLRNSAALDHLYSRPNPCGSTKCPGPHRLR